MSPDTLKTSRAVAKASCFSGRFRVDGRFLARGDERVWLRGVTYGPFAPDSHGNPFPARRTVREDLARISEVGFNAIRIYHVPPPWLLEIAGETGDIGVLIDVPWSKHVCFLDTRGAQQEARQAVRRAAM